jgi:hypothetical protein
MKKTPDQPTVTPHVSPNSQPTLPDEERKRLVAALETARENVKPTVKRLMESESVSNDLLSMRLERHVHEFGEY